jgi:alkylhydroperoxidase/carboxymuconolactone decarboxylase family protein YurZ
MTNAEKRQFILEIVDKAAEQGNRDSAEIAAWIRWVSCEDGEPRLRSEAHMHVEEALEAGLTAERIGRVLRAAANP